MDHVLLSSNFLLKIIKAIWVHTPYGPLNTSLYLFRYNISVIQKCPKSLLGFHNNQTVLYTALNLRFLLFSPWYHLPPSHVMKSSTACALLPLTGLLKSNISKIIHLSLVQVPLQDTAICSREISPGCSYTVNLIRHYQRVQMKAAVPFYNTNGNIYAAKW